jgi:hypothetical protein
MVIALLRHTVKDLGDRGEEFTKVFLVLVGSVKGLGY